MGDKFKYDQAKLTPDCKPFLKSGISMADVSRFKENQKTRDIVLPKPRRNVKRAESFIL